MRPDQAAGLRRRQGSAPRCIHCFSSSGATGVRLAVALHRCGWNVLRVDTVARASNRMPARSLFDWRRQLARRQVSLLPMAHGDAWHAPGMQADVPEFATLAPHYDALLLEVDSCCDAWRAMPGADNRIVIELAADTLALRQAYALVKTLCSEQAGCEVSLVGDALACRRLQDAAERFLGASCAQTLSCFAHEIEPFAALAIRMAGEEKGHDARH